MSIVNIPELVLDLTIYLENEIEENTTPRNAIIEKVNNFVNNSLAECFNQQGIEITLKRPASFTTKLESISHHDLSVHKKSYDALKHFFSDASSAKINPIYYKKLLKALEEQWQETCEADLLKKKYVEVDKEMELGGDEKMELSESEKNITINEEMELNEGRVEKNQELNDKLNKLNDSLSMEGDDGGLYFKKLLKSVSEIQTISNSSSLETLQSKLNSDNLKLCLYCIVKHESLIKEIIELIKSTGLKSPDLPEADLEKLSALLKVVEPLKKNIEEQTAIFPQPPEDSVKPLTHQEILARLTEARSLAKEKNLSPHQLTTVHVLFWEAAQSLFIEGKQEEGFAIVKEASAIFSASASHPMATMALDMKNARSFYGINWSGLGASHIKEHAIHGSLRTIDQQPTLCLDFKINSPTYQWLAEHAKILKTIDPTKLESLLPKDLMTKISINERAEMNYLENVNGEFSRSKVLRFPGAPQLEITFRNLGTVRLGLNSQFKVGANTVQVEMPYSDDSAANLKKMHAMLTVLGCPPVAVESRFEDKQRRAILHVFRSFYPHEAREFERNSSLCSIPPKLLCEKICKNHTDMAEKFRFALDENMLPHAERENIPGKRMPVVPISEQVRKQGAVGLFCGISQPMKEAASIVSKILQDGMSSSQRRFSAGINTFGVSSYTDAKEGGAEGVFLRMATDELVTTKSIKDFAYTYKLQLLVDLDVVNVGNTYGFTSDRYGSRAGASYFARSNLIDLAAALQTDRKKLFGRPQEVAKFGTANEVIVRDGVPPQAIRRIVVQNNEDKQTLIEQLIKNGVAKCIKNIYCVNNTPITDFIVVSEKFKKEMWI